MAKWDKKPLYRKVNTTAHGVHDLHGDDFRTLPAGRFRPLFDTAYGQREFHVIDPDALLISFGERIRN